MPEIPSLVYKFFAITLLVYVSYGLLLVLNEKKYVYYPNFPSLRDFGDCQDLNSAQPVIYKESRFYYKHLSDKVAVMYHGNAGNACDRAVFADLFEKMGYSYLIVEYPGYGNDLVGGPSKKRILESVAGIQEFLKEKKFNKVILVGESLGVGVASYHASTTSVDRLVFISPYYELSDMAGWIGYVYPVRFLMKENYTPGLWLKEVKAPTLFVYASDDEIVPRWSMEKLYNSMSGQKKLVEITGTTHNSMYSYPEFFTAIEEFLTYT